MQRGGEVRADGAAEDGDELGHGGAGLGVRGAAGGLPQREQAVGGAGPGLEPAAAAAPQPQPRRHPPPVPGVQRRGQVQPH